MDDSGLDGVQVFADDPRIEALASYTDHLEELVAVYNDALAGDVLDRPPAEGYWTVAQVIHHLADAELIASVQVRDLIVGREPRWGDWDAVAYADALLYDVRPPEDALTLILSLRQTNSRLLAALPPDAWAGTTSAAAGGPADLADWVRLSVEHLHTRVLQGRRAVVGLI